MAKFCQYGLTPASVSPMRNTVTTSAPTRVPERRPRPPNKLVPPITTAVIVSRLTSVVKSGATETLVTSLRQVHDCTMDQNCTFTFSNPAPSGQCSSFVLILRGAFTPTLPASVKWNGGAAPTYTTPSMYTFTTVDGGTIWLGAQVGKAFA